MKYYNKSNVTTTPVQLSIDRMCTAVMVQNHPSNTVDLAVGDSTLQPFILTPGMAITLDVSNANEVWVASVSGTATNVPWGVA